MNNRIRQLIEREEQGKARSYELMEKYKRVLRRTMQKIDCEGKQGVVYSNEEMIDKVEGELYDNVKFMNKLEKELSQSNNLCEKVLHKENVQRVQKDVELLNQQIRIIEATLGYIKK